MKKWGLIIAYIYLLINISYAEKWIGRAATYQLVTGSKTANGDIFNTETMTAACNGFKFGSTITIINPIKNKQISVLVNDRIEEDYNYFILLSPKAARELNLEWESGLVIVEAKFSDVNSTEILPINGLVNEGDVDLEKLKKFPYINWPESTKQKELESDNIKKSIDVTSDIYVENNQDSQNVEEKINPETDKQTEINYPPPNSNLAKLGEDNDDDFLVEEIRKAETIFPEIENALTNEPERHETQIRISSDDDIDFDYFERKIQESPEETNENVIALQKLDHQYLLDKDDDNNFINHSLNNQDIVNDIKIVWQDKLIPGKLYIRFSTSFDQKEGERRMQIFSKIYPNLIGLNRSGKYILLLGPFEEKNINEEMSKIRKYGFKDAIITND